MSRAVRRVVVAAAAASLLGVAACGESESDEGAPATSGAKTACVEEAQAAVDKALEPVEPAFPTAKVDMQKNAGKTIWLITPVDNEFTNGVTAGAKEAADAAGIELKVFHGKAEVNLWNQGVREAVAQKADGLILIAIDPKLVSEPLADAKEAGIPIIDSFNGDPGDPLDGLFAHVTSNYSADARVMADFALAQTNCDTHIANFSKSLYALFKKVDAAIEEEVERLCPDCSVVKENVDETTQATDLGPQTTTTLRRDPDINFLIATSDATALYMVPAVASAGSDVKLISHDGAPANLDFVREGQVQIADIASPPTGIIGWAQVDQLGRAMAGQEAVEVDIPSQLFTTETIPEGNSDGDLFPGFAGYQEKYRALWGTG